MSTNILIMSDRRYEFKRLEGAYAPATLKSYYADIEIYENWCIVRGLEPFPALVSIICQSLEEQAPAQCLGIGRHGPFVFTESYSSNCDKYFPYSFFPNIEARFCS